MKLFLKTFTSKFDNLIFLSQSKVKNEEYGDDTFCILIYLVFHTTQPYGATV